MFLQGVFPALVTPLTPEEEVDTAALRRVVRYCLDAGVHGVVVLGTTGEFPAMTEKMRATAIETVLSEVNGQVPVVAGCGDTSTKKTLAQVVAAGQTGVDAVLVALPYYYPLDQAAVIRHFTAVADKSTKPVIVYNFPQMTKIAVAPATLKTLAAHGNIIGVKDSAGDFINLSRFLAVTADQPDFAVMVGNPALALAAFIHGAKGGIFAGCSLAPKLCVDLYEAYRRGDLATAVTLQRQALHFSEMGNFGTPAAVIKAGLAKMGICGPTASMPLGLRNEPAVLDKIYAWMGQLGLPQ